MAESTSSSQQKTLLQELRDETRERTLSYIIGGFGLVAGLAWNEVVGTLIETIFPTTQNSLLAKFLYAIGMTVILVVAVIALNRLLKKRS